MKKTITKQMLSLILSVLMLFTMVAPMTAFAYSASKNNLNTKYSLTGNGASDIVAVAKAQLGRKYTAFSGFHAHAWCADFVSACAAASNQSSAIPGSASCATLRANIKNAGGDEHSKKSIKNGNYTPIKGDIIFLLSNGESHVGIVEYSANGYIYYIDGNNIKNGNGNNSSVQRSKRSFSNAGFTCVVSPKYTNKSNRKTYITAFSSLKGKGYSLAQARTSASTTFKNNQTVYAWCYLHDANNNLYKSYCSAACNLTMSFYRPDGSCAFSYTYKNSDNNWIGCKVNKSGKWKIVCKVNGSITGSVTHTFTVK